MHKQTLQIYLHKSVYVYIYSAISHSEMKRSGIELSFTLAYIILQKNSFVKRKVS